MRFSIDRDDLDRWCQQMIGTDNLQSTRVSSLFKVQTLTLYNMGNKMQAVGTAVRDIDLGIVQSRGMKVDSQFEHLPLRGLWKKHVYDLASEASNLKSEFADPKSYFGTRLRKLFKEHDGESFNTIRDDVIDLAINAMANRERVGALTGEWIVYSRVEGKNLVLTYATHNEGSTREEGDMKIYQRVLSCKKEFPELELLHGDE